MIDAHGFPRNQTETQSMPLRHALFFISTIALLWCCSPARALAADPWSDADKTREAVYLILHAADWGQTRSIADSPESYRENNPFLGEHPTQKRVDAYFAATALLHIGITHVLPADWRPAFQYFFIGLESGVVVNNYRAGVRINF
jgi:hypothetical protein